MRRLAALPALFFAPVVLATTMIALTPEELVRAADVVAVAHVQSVEAVRSKGRITTLARLVVETPVKGPVKGTELLVRIPGGEAGDQVQLVPGAPILTEGERAVVFLEEAGGDTWRFVGLEQGRLTVEGTGPAAVVRRTHTARLVRTNGGVLQDASPEPEVESLAKLLVRLRAAAGTTR